jgi:KDO2-lipid IV(A) lauroyltransferase
MLFFLKIIARLPDRFLYILADILAWILRCVVRYRRTTVDKNLLLAFPEKSQEFRCDILNGFYCHIADVVVETLMLSRISLGQLLQRVNVVGVEYLDVSVKKNQSIILLSAHQGNWEWMLAAIASSISCPLDALYRPLHNSVMDQFFIDIRSRFGASLIPAEKAARAILKLRREVRAFGIIGDQNPRKKDDKYWTTFMGIETPVAVGPERIAKLTGYPVFYVSMERLSRGRYRCAITPLAEAPYAGEGDISQQYISAVEAHIRNQPECWMWSHHRWRYSKVDCPRNMMMDQKTYQ